MAKEKGQENIWKALEGKKGSLSDEVPIRMGEVEVVVPIKFVDIDKTREINEEYEERKPNKPIINVKIGNNKVNIEVPSDEEKFEKFNSHPEAKKWLKECQPLDKERRARLAYEFIEDDYRPADSPENGVKRLLDEDDGLREMDILNIVQAGFKLNGMSDKIDEAEKNS